ncbi:hypothetical protein BCR42DRAFT_444870 [Absidia repens]|uniref:Uncharacterized protein n=1 Tax=Absidia repens TaxID=90262 RepID=A0A1X2IZP3_9FUNG|nr:hypothetical protein BCR42DRAFT_444870 [Absidia repens]
MANNLHGISFDRTSTTSSKRSQGPFLNKIKSSLVKFIKRRRHSPIVDSFRPTKHQYSPTRQASFSDNSEHSQSDDDYNNDSEDDLDSSSDNRTNNELQQSIYSKDDDVERLRYNKATCYQHQHNQPQTTVSILSPPPTILVKRSSTQASTNHRHTNSLQNSFVTASSSSHHRYTSSLQSSSIISVPGSSNSGKPAHYHHSRHYSHISFMSASNMTVNSEDLTAKEFADMAGIRIIPDSDDNGDDQPDDTAATSTLEASTATSASLAPAKHQHQQRPSYHSNQPSEETDWSVITSASQQSQQNGPATTKIWDTGFWRQPCADNTAEPMKASSAQKQQQLLPLLPTDSIPTLKKQRSALLQHRQTLSLPSTVTTTPCQHANSTNNCEFPIIHELRRIHSTSNSSNSQQQVNSNTIGDSCVIRKGRFEIQLEP